MNDKNKAILVSITGRVQGVCFRAETQKAARGIGVSGYVRNMPDGSVQAMFQGEQKELDDMLAWCWKGSPFAAVDAVIAEGIPARNDLTGFEIRWT